MKHFSEDDVTALRNSDQFNADWYLEQYPDVKMLAMDPFEHYLWLGRRLHRKPQPDMLFIKERINWGIISTPHTIFIADIIAERLRLHGWHVDIMTSPPENFDHDQYFVICPQMFDRLPSGEKLISFQMEQSINERWFTQSYLEILENSFAVLDYSLVNVDFLSGKGINYPHLYYLPVGTLDQRSGSCDKNIDVLFYGDSKSSKRRREMLDALCSEFNVYVASEVFGSEMTDLIRRSKLVINLHYYENALLEMPRIQECLSNGTQVVSESAQDQCHYPELIGAVQFFETGSIAAMLRTVREALSAYEKVEYDIGEKIKSSVRSSRHAYAASKPDSLSPRVRGENFRHAPYSKA